MSSASIRFYGQLSRRASGPSKVCCWLLLYVRLDLRIYLKESVLEIIRACDFPDKPRRLGSVFLCPTLEDAKLYQKFMGDRPHLYVCDMEGDSHLADLGFVQSADPLMPIRQQLDELRGRARRYWSGDKSDNPIMEIITSGRVAITRCLSEPGRGG